MKILFVNTYHYDRGGDTKYAFNLAKLLSDHGHEIKYLSMLHPKNQPSSEEKYFVSYIDYREMQGKNTCFNIFKVIGRSIYSTESKNKIRKLIIDFQPNIIHVFNIHAHITPSIFFEIIKYKIPIVWTLNDYKLICPNSHFINDHTNKICEDCLGGRYYKPILNKCKKGSLGASIIISIEAYLHKYMNIVGKVSILLCQSKFQQKKMREYGIPEDKLEHLPLFVNQSNRLPRNENLEVYFLFIGRIERFKGIFTLLKAFKDIPEIKLKIVGSLPSEIKKEFTEALSMNTEYIGFVVDEIKEELINNSLYVIVPSENYENQPLSILEAFAHSKPVIASNLGGMSELVIESNAGYLFEPGNARELKEIVIKTSNNYALARQKGEQGYTYISRYHSSNSHYQKLLDIYKRYIKGN